ncbi:hypothetical protein [Natrinema amylolyticum]|uniref:hypothetical protein n=1 Tax=Natrinema amylolyticum TaxID=2878679 RepID=UPI001CF99E65|nr:hypothetical protein [Natrinema amylolyticum]
MSSDYDENTLAQVVALIDEHIDAAKAVKEKYDSNTSQFNGAHHRQAELRGLKHEIAHRFFGEVKWEDVDL